MSSVAETLIDAPATTSAINLTAGAANEVRRIMAENKIPEAISCAWALQVAVALV